MIEAIAASPAVYSIGWSLVQFAWQGTLAAAVAALALVALSGANARIRYWTACAAMLVMVALPIRTALGTYMAMAPESGPHQVAAAARTTVSPSRAETPPAPMPVTGTAPIGPTAATGGWTTTLDLQSLIPAIVMAWILGVFVLSARIAGGWVLVRRMRRQGTQASEELSETVGRIARRARLARPVRVIESAIVEAPAVVGWLRPVVLLPASAVTGLSPEQLQAVIAHELAHIRQQDYLVNIFQTVAETLLFYHPGVWWLSNRIRAEREHCADDFAVTVCGDAVLYAQALSNLETSRAAARLAVGAGGGPLSDRIKRILDQPAHRNRPEWVGLALSAAIAVVLLGFGGSQAAAIATSAPRLLPAPPPAGLAEPASTPQAPPAGAPQPTPESSKAAESSTGVQETPAQSEERPAAGARRTIVVQGPENDRENVIQTFNQRIDYVDLENLIRQVNEARGNVPEHIRDFEVQGSDIDLENVIRTLNEWIDDTGLENLFGVVNEALGNLPEQIRNIPPTDNTDEEVRNRVEELQNFEQSVNAVEQLRNNMEELRDIGGTAPEPIQIRLEPGRQESSWMGVQIEDGPDRGVVVSGVEPNGPASEVEIQEGDLITAFDGTSVVGVVQFTRLVSETPVGRTVEVTFSRNAEEQSVTLTLAPRPSPVGAAIRLASSRSLAPNGSIAFVSERDGSAYRIYEYDGNVLRMLGPNEWLPGVEVDEMTSELRQFFGADPDTGVLIVSVDDDSFGAGLQVGDVIVAVDGNRVGSGSDLRNLSGGVLGTGNALTVNVLRDRSELEIEVESSSDR